MQTTSSYTVRHPDLTYALDTWQYSSHPRFRWNTAECALRDAQNMKIWISQYLYHGFGRWKVCIYMYIYISSPPSVVQAVKWLRERERVAGLSHRRFRFDIRPFYVGFVLNKIGLWRISLRDFQFSPFSNIPPTLYTRLFITCLRYIHCNLGKWKRR